MKDTVKRMKTSHRLGENTWKTDIWERTSVQSIQRTLQGF